MPKVNIEGVGQVNFPDDMTPEQITQAIERDIMPSAKQAAQAPEQPQQQPGDWKREVRQGAGDLAAGAIRGAGSIGATLLTPIDYAARKIGVQNQFIGRDDRRETMTSALGELGANTDSGLFATGKIAGEIAGTAGAPGALANGAAAIPALAKFAPAIASGGFNLGSAATGNVLANTAIRAGTGAVAGAGAAGLADPSQAGAGAVIGGVLPVGVKLAGEAGKAVRGIGKQALGATTGTSAETVSAAFKAGRDGNASFLDNMRGKASFDDVVDSAKSGLDNMRLERGAQYRSGMVDISRDKNILDFAEIDKAIHNATDKATFKGRVTNTPAAKATQDMMTAVNEWKSLNPAEYHTPEGFDALKRAISGIQEAIPYEQRTARSAAGEIYSAVKGTISKQAPTYSDVMKDYAKASDEISEIQRALSLGDNASKDTAIRKLQSLMRNNAQSNYGNRLSLASNLEQKGGVEITPAIAGQAMNTWMPRGLIGAIEKPALAVGAALNPKILAMAPFTSPRLMGEALYKAGAGANKTQEALNKAGGLLLPKESQRLMLQGLLSGTPVISLTNQQAQR